MSNSWLSIFKFPPPADSIRPQEKRILEESSPTGSPINIPTKKHSLSTPSNVLLSEPEPSATPAPRMNRNKVIFGAGLGFFALSVLITRRSFARRRLTALSNTLPPPSSNASFAQSQAANAASGVSGGFYSGAPQHVAQASAKVSGAMEAVEALNIATINVLSVTMMVAGGALWYLDINSMEEARRFIRGGLGVDGTGRSEKDAEEEFEEWMASTLARKEDREKVRSVR